MNRIFQLCECANGCFGGHIHTLFDNEDLISSLFPFLSRLGFFLPAGHLDIVKYLVAHNAEINLANAYNNTCLMISAYKGHTDVVEFLLSHGADPDQQAHCGATALHYAAECGHVDICAALLNYGATLKRNEYDMTAVTTAAERTREKVVELFYGIPDLLTKEEVNYIQAKRFKCVDKC